MSRGPHRRGGARPGPAVARGGAWVLALVLFACSELTGGPLPAQRLRTEPVPGAVEPVGNERCQRCHGHQPAPAHHADCEGCHGPGGLHLTRITEPGLMRYPTDGECLGCHPATAHDWEGSMHRDAGLSCTSCHDPHQPEPGHPRPVETPGLRFARAGDGSARCAGCHPEVVARLDLPSHHPVREGHVACGDCHDAHDPGPDRLLRSTDACTSCHAEQAGPWIYEHAPVVEDCGSCHRPHGSSARSLLEASEPGVCVSCHTLAELGAIHQTQAYVTRCSDCHGAIHGSYADPFLRH